MAFSWPFGTLDASTQARVDVYAPYAVETANKYGIPANLFLAQIFQESSFNPSAQTGNAMGIAQLDYAQGGRFNADIWNPFEAMTAAARIDKILYNRHGDWGAVLNEYGTTAGHSPGTGGTGLQNIWTTLSSLGQGSTPSLGGNTISPTAQAQAQQDSQQTTPSICSMADMSMFPWLQGFCKDKMPAQGSVPSQSTNSTSTSGGCSWYDLPCQLNSIGEYITRAVLVAVGLAILFGALIIYAAQARQS